ncbi:hypothetical protein ABQE58_25085 [Mycolicibacterium elephantis]
MTQLDPDQYRAVRYCVAEVVRRRLLGGQPVPAWLRSLHHHLTSSVGGTDTAVPQRESSEAIDTAEAARILGCSTRYIRRIAADLDGQHVAGRWIFHRHTVTEYAEAKRTRTDG